MLPEDDHMIETCRSVLSVLMWMWNSSVYKPNRNYHAEHD